MECCSKHRTQRAQWSRTNFFTRYIQINTAATPAKTSVANKTSNTTRSYEHTVQPNTHREHYVEHNSLSLTQHRTEHRDTNLTSNRTQGCEQNTEQNNNCEQNIEQNWYLQTPSQTVQWIACRKHSERTGPQQTWWPSWAKPTESDNLITTGGLTVNPF